MSQEHNPWPPLWPSCNKLLHNACFSRSACPTLYFVMSPGSRVKSERVITPRPNVKTGTMKLDLLSLRQWHVLVVGRWLLTTQALIQARGSPSGICAECSGTKARFSTSPSSSIVKLSFNQWSIFIHVSFSGMDNETIRSLTTNTIRPHTRDYTSQIVYTHTTQCLMNRIRRL